MKYVHTGTDYWITTRAYNLYRGGGGGGGGGGRGPQTQWHQVKMGGLQSKVMSFIPCIGVLEFFLLESASVQTVSVS